MQKSNQAWHEPSLELSSTAEGVIVFGQLEVLSGQSRSGTSATTWRGHASGKGEKKGASVKLGVQAFAQEIRIPFGLGEERG